MTSYLAVTTCNAAQWRQYGRAMVKTYLRHWPAAVDLLFYAEDFNPDILFPNERADKPTIIVRDLDESAPWLAGFKARYGDDARNRGGEDGRDYRRNAIKFAHKVAALGAAAEDGEFDVLIWIDADVVTHAPVTRDWLDSLFPKHAHLAWLDRLRGIYPECGFVMYRMPHCAKLIGKLVETYRGGSVFRFAETHDSYVLQQLANEMAAHGRLKIWSLSGDGRVHTGHPFVNSPLSACLDHLKGESRKTQGHSHARDLKVPRKETYWAKIKAAADGRSG